MIGKSIEDVSLSKFLTQNNMTKQEFLDALECEFDTMLKIAEAKNADYCGSDDPFANFRQIENIGVTTAEVGILVRMSDKMSRIANLL